MPEKANFHFELNFVIFWIQWVAGCLERIDIMFIWWDLLYLMQDMENWHLLDPPPTVATRPRLNDITVCYSALQR